jgi:uncharacterized membrane protein
MKKPTILKVILALAVLGLLTSIYLLQEHYSEASGICDINETVSCSLVNSSIYSMLFGVPVAVFGGIWFIFLFALAWQAIRQEKLIPFLLAWNVLGLLFVVYLVIAEILLRAICPFCTVVHIITLITFILSLILFKQLKKKAKKIDGKLLKKWVLALIVVNILPLIFFNISYGEQQNFDELAQCITEQEVHMYGSFRCGVCAKTRAMFGDAFQYINEIECHPQGENSEWELCQGKEITGTPTWILEPSGVEEKRFEGFMTTNELAEFAGCE